MSPGDIGLNIFGFWLKGVFLEKGCLWQLNIFTYLKYQGFAINTEEKLIMNSIVGIGKCNQRIFHTILFILQ